MRMTYLVVLSNFLQISNELRDRSISFWIWSDSLWFLMYSIKCDKVFFVRVTPPFIVCRETFMTCEKSIHVRCFVSWLINWHLWVSMIFLIYGVYVEQDRPYYFAQFIIHQAILWYASIPQLINIDLKATLNFACLSYLVLGKYLINFIYFLFQLYFIYLAMRRGSSCPWHARLIALLLHQLLLLSVFDSHYQHY